jgi:hypothetical protein
MTGCNAKNTNKPQETYAKPLEMLSADGIGPINAQTPFNLHDITMAFQGLNVTQNSNFNSGKEYPTINVAKDIKTLLIINPDVKHEKIFSVMVKDNLIGNRLGHSIGTRYADIYAYDKTEECAPGTEELAGKVLCYAPKTGNILYLFSGQWNGDKNKVPPKETLANWTLEAMIWKPIQNK